MFERKETDKGKARHWKEREKNLLGGEKEQRKAKTGKSNRKRKKLKVKTKFIAERGKVVRADE